MSEQSWFDWTPFILVLIWLVIISPLGYCAYKHQEALDNACTAKGGVPYHSRDSGMICLNPDSVIK